MHIKNYFAVALLLFGSGCSNRPDDAKEVMWNESPFIATKTSMPEINDLVLWVTNDKPDDLNLDATSAELNRVSKFVYDLECAQGKFRITFLGPEFLPDLPEKTSQNAESDFSKTSRCLLMASDCKDNELWFVRSQIYPRGLKKGKRFEIFAEKTKRGFVTGSISDPGENYLVLFDGKGRIAAKIFVLEPNADSWDELCTRLALEERETKVSSTNGTVVK